VSDYDLTLGEKWPLRILLAEDNATNQKLATHILDRLGYRIDVAGNGLEAIEALERQRYDVVLMDVQMPEMDGLEASRRICTRWPRGERPYIVAMTANAMQGDREMCLAAGMDDYIAKPIRVDQLMDALRRVPVAEAAASAEAAAPQPEIPEVQTVIDPAALDSLRKTMGGKLEYLIEMVDSYREDAPKALADMRKAAASGEAALLRRAAHTLKSNSTDFGATALAHMCKELEELGKTGALEGAAERVAQAEAEYEQVRTTLEALMKAQR
jgi:CheY-like chemotaxis protein